MSTVDMADDGDLGIPMRPLFMGDVYRPFSTMNGGNNGQANGRQLERSASSERSYDARRQKINRLLSAGTPKEKWFLKLVSVAAFIDVRSFLEVSLKFFVLFIYLY